MKLFCLQSQTADWQPSQKIFRMQAIDSATQLPPMLATIGNFDGMHRGHQRIIDLLKQTARAEQLKSLVFIFEPQPLEYFKGQDAPPRLTSLREKLAILAQHEVDYVVVARFNADFRAMSAFDFAEMLNKRLNVKRLILGDDFHFGKDRSGDSAFLRQYGFQVSNLDTVLFDGQRISSTRIRQTLQQGDFALATQLLGRPYSITGRVLHGDKIGRTLDFPTINVALNRCKPCLQGIYAVDVECLQLNLSDYVKQQQPNRPQLHGIAGYHPHSLFGAGHIGVRPAIRQNKPQWRLEVHFPDVSADLYGLLMRVTFLHFLHGEKNYPSLAALKTGIADDVRQLRQYRHNTVQFPL